MTEKWLKRETFCLRCEYIYEYIVLVNGCCDIMSGSLDPEMVFLTSQLKLVQDLISSVGN